MIFAVIQKSTHPLWHSTDANWRELCRTKCDRHCLRHLTSPREWASASLLRLLFSVCLYIYGNVLAYFTPCGGLQSSLTQYCREHAFGGDIRYRASSRVWVTSDGFHAWWPSSRVDILKTERDWNRNAAYTNQASLPSPATLLDTKIRWSGLMW